VSAKERPGQVSEATTHRLSLLLRGLRVLDAAGTATISSSALAERFDLNAAQIRKDLALYGEFGVRGLGYRVRELKARLTSLMGLDRSRTVVIVGAGNLGQALADSRNFNGEGFRVVGLYDADGRKIGARSRTGVPIRDVRELPAALAASRPDIGVITAPADAAPGLASQLASAGVPAILNFAPVRVPPLLGSVVKNVDLTLFLENLAYQLARRGA